VPPGGTEQITKQGTGFHAGEDTTFAGTRPSVIHRAAEAVDQAALVPEDDEPFEDEPDDEDPDDEEDPDDDDSDDDEEEEDPEPEVPDEDDDSAFAGTEPLPDERLSVR
jgi:hypothetical protein